MKIKKLGMTRSLGKVAIATILACCSAAASATPVGTEVGDAGQSLITAQSFTGSGPLTAIRGNLTGFSDMADMYKIYLTAGTLFSATTAGSGIAFNNFDTTLFLFNSAGMGLVANDDDPGAGPTSTILNFNPSGDGFYYLAIGGAGFTPVSAGGAIFGNLIGQDQVGPTGPGGGAPLTNWISATSEGDAYEILLAGALAVDPNGTVPEPPSWLLMALGIGVVATARGARAKFGAVRS
jgi:hypothetical protein